MIRRGFPNKRRLSVQSEIASGHITGATCGGTAFVPLTYVADNWTVELWAYPTTSVTLWAEKTTAADAVTGNAIPIGAANESANRGGGLSIGTNGILMLIHGTSTINPLAKYEGSVTGWNHIAGVSTEKAASIALNGATVRSGLTCPTTYYYSPRGYFGGFHDYGSYTGWIDEIRIWNYAKTDAQILETMYQRVIPGANGLISLIRYVASLGLPYDFVLDRPVALNKTLQYSIANPCPHLLSYC